MLLGETVLEETIFAFGPVPEHKAGFDVRIPHSRRVAPTDYRGYRTPYGSSYVHGTGVVPNVSYRQAKKFDEFVNIHRLRKEAECCRSWHELFAVTS